MLESYGPGGAWQVRVVTNRYPAFSGNEPMVVTHLGPVYTQAPASGIHEVLVLAPEHNASWADLSESHAALVMEALRDRMTAHAATGLRYSQAVVNSGREAGASHRAPPRPAAVDAVHPRARPPTSWPDSPASRATACCAPCSTPRRRRSTAWYSRTIGWSMISPFWGGTPYELLIMPRQHEPHLHHADSADLAGIGRSVQRALAGPAIPPGRRGLQPHVPLGAVPPERRLPLARPPHAQDLDPGRLRDGLRGFSSTWCRRSGPPTSCAAEVGAPA